ncbi:LytTR family DNA-binding domain-containing protein [Lacicoccus qingdaonensis]|uniref:Transcriptional regulator, LytTR family n=1 Tax=Lacicoccus qingdaonensis TaxID=576118 RepID=A0A1G9FIG0_9BACL|nr:LytTR family DNA-binding domain-containing protein [Salinicoccus qingdaonensis]SDK88191.1 transcriptional regulator, LytTR family [Salinicoccus qingdaonensis]
MKTELIIDEQLNDDEIKIHTKTATVGARILSFIDHFTTDRENLAIRSDEEFLMVQKSDIICAEVQDKTLTISTKDDDIVTTKTLSALMEELQSETFMKVSKSGMLNIQMIDRVEPSFSGNLIARMKNGNKVSISRRYVSKLKERLGI